jgi:hypothetical protein
LLRVEVANSGHLPEASEVRRGGKEEAGAAGVQEETIGRKQSEDISIRRQREYTTTNPPSSSTETLLS